MLKSTDKKVINLLAMIQDIENKHYYVNNGEKEYIRCQICYNKFNNDKTEIVYKSIKFEDIAIIVCEKCKRKFELPRVKDL